MLKSNFTLRYLVLQLYLVIKASIFVPTLVGSFEFRYQLCGLYASIFREGPGNDLQGFGKFVDGILFKACTSLTENRNQLTANQQYKFTRSRLFKATIQTCRLGEGAHVTCL